MLLIISKGLLGGLMLKFGAPLPGVMNLNLNLVIAYVPWIRHRVTLIVSNSIYLSLVGVA